MPSKDISPNAAEHPDDEKLDDSYAALTKARRQGQKSSIVEMSLVAAAAILIAVSTLFSAWNTFELRQITKESAQIRQVILLGTECIVEQLAEHRHLNAIGHRANAAHEGYTYPIPEDEEPPGVPGELEKACEAFIATTTTTSIP